MPQGLEIEIKLVATPAMLEELRNHPALAGEDQASTLVTTYFDTSKGSLRLGGAALRVREKGDSREQTLKLASNQGTAIQRQEWNISILGDRPDASAFPEEAQSALAKLVGGERLKAAAKTRIERTTRQLQFGTSTIEIAFDLGAIEASDRREPVSELELELVEGELADVLALALTLPLGPELGWSILSKAERCHSLAYDQPTNAVHAHAIKLDPAMDVAQGFQLIAWNCLEQLLANYPLVLQTGNAEAVHQTRVAIRRLRVAGGLFAKMIDNDLGPVLQAELKAVASVLGPARDLQVLTERVALAAETGEVELREMLGHLSVRSEQAITEAQKLLASEPFQHMLFTFAKWLESGDWLNRKVEPGGDQALAPFAAHALSRRRRKLRRAKHPLSELSEADRHRLRINTKKLRYSHMFFAALFSKRKGTKQRTSFMKALGKLQDSLGELNDMAVATSEHATLFYGLEQITAARYTAQLKALLFAEEKSRNALLKTAQKSISKVMDAPMWWKAD